LEVAEGHGDDGATVGCSLFYQLHLNSVKHTQVSARFVAISGPVIEANADVHCHIFKLTDHDYDSDSDTTDSSDDSIQWSRVSSI